MVTELKIAESAAKPVSDWKVQRLSKAQFAIERLEASRVEPSGRHCAFKSKQEAPKFRRIYSLTGEKSSDVLNLDHLRQLESRPSSFYIEQERNYG